MRNLHNIFHKWLHQFRFPPTVQEGSLFTTSSILVISCLFDNSYSNRWEWIAGLLFVRPLAYVFTYLLDCKLRGSKERLRFLLHLPDLASVCFSSLILIFSHTKPLYYLLNHSHHNMWWLWRSRQGAFCLAHCPTWLRMSTSLLSGPVQHHLLHEAEGDPWNIPQVT